ncbi:D-2-hydroxyacid dehydrogenase [Paenibacillus hodogayensis]|uniref:D-2-hydroxyacid dehydrogenase n=1 Tax=Paenibacillus hodogayensis TaxID=279208 RepID=A0ABV5VZ94_9BACL
MTKASSILVLAKLEPEQLERIRQAAPESEVWTAEQPLEDRHYREAEIICGWNARAKQLSLAPDSALRWLQGWGAGIEKLPLDAIKERGIWLTNASGVHAYPISESVFAMLLAFTRRLHRAVRNQAERRWEPQRDQGEAHGQTIGILGVGEIGREVARLAKAFRMQVLGVRRSGEAEPFVDRMTTFAGLSDVLAESDYIVNCLPLTAETKGIMDRDRFRLMKPDAFYMNIGRGGTTDTGALLEALREGWIAGAGLDVFEEEPLPAEHPLWGFDNVIITPHHTGGTSHYNRRAVDLFIANLEAYRLGRMLPINLIPPERMY